MSGKSTKGKAFREDARLRLLEAALDVFCKHGFEGASTRMIANCAEVNLAAIPYYFGGKEGLYLAVIDLIADRIAELILPRTKEVIERLRTAERLTEAELTELLVIHVGNLTSMMVGTPEAAKWGRIVVREQMDPTRGFSVLYERLIKLGHGLLSELVARLRGIDAESAEATLFAHTLLGQVMIFRAARETLVVRLGYQGFSAEEVAEIRRVIEENVRTLAHAWAAGGTKQKRRSAK